MLDSTVYLDKLNLNLYNAIDAAVFIKNEQGRYLWANSFFIYRSAGFNSMGEIKNKMDHDFPWQEHANELRANDQKVISARQSLSHYERIIRHDGTVVNILTRKSPLVDRNKQFIGVVGFSIELPKPPHLSVLSKREQECVYFLSLGYTDKQTAKQLNISPRTVETHILAAKRRLSVASRAELVAIFCHVYP